MYLNKVQLYGNITKDIELRTTQGGSNVASFSIATNRTWKDKGGKKQEDTQFHNVVAWGKTAELIDQYMSKGSAIYIEGRLQTRSYETKDGQKRYVTEVVVENMQFGPKKAGSGATTETESGPEPEEESKVPDIDLGDIPF